ncbi:MAG: cytochrome c3 family protein [Acidobacteriota bacterium]|nr:cytochrome c3 family protein [Acidobacteriota bacterium]
MRSRKGRTKGSIGALLVILIALSGTVLAQEILLPPPPPPARDYGKVVLHAQAAHSPGDVVFDHWLHRSHFTCRVCHVDIGFAMQAGETGITAESNRQGFHCGTCHNGQRLFNGKPIFAACNDGPTNSTCDRCHSVGKPGARKYNYESYTSRYPRLTYGINWQLAEERGIIKPVDTLEGMAQAPKKLAPREDFSIKANLDWVHPVYFSHEKHTVWNGCELCHPDIFPTVKRSAAHYTMFSNLEGRHCGACHNQVAFPLNNCSMCHPRAPEWASK